MFEGKKVFILGMARSGYEVAKVLVAHHAKITINDSKESQDLEQVKELENLGVNIILGGHPEEIFDDTFDYLIKNPGIRNDHIYVKKAEQFNIPVINEMEVAYHYMPKGVKLIGITGSNGKTTTTTLIYEFLKGASLPVHLAGNMGYPLCSFLKNIKENDIVVCEVSVQQLCNLKDFKTDISVLTNLTEAHLDFVGSYENYQQLKKRIFHHHTKNDIAVLNKSDPLVLKLTGDIKSTKKYFAGTLKDAYLDGNEIKYEGKLIFNIDEIILKGMHNYENIMAAIVVAKEFGVTNEIILKVLKEFKGVPHRLEYVRCLKGRTFYNDSKATNNKSTEIALKTFHTPTILLMGGLDRGIPFDELKPFMEHVKLIVCYGETRDKIEQFAKNCQIPVQKTEFLKDAIQKAYQNSQSRDTIVLSPACASWDQYQKFEDRGDEFKKCVNELK